MVYGRQECHHPAAGLVYESLSFVLGSKIPRVAQEAVRYPAPANPIDRGGACPFEGQDPKKCSGGGPPSAASLRGPAAGQAIQNKKTDEAYFTFLTAANFEPTNNRTGRPSGPRPIVIDPSAANGYMCEICKTTNDCARSLHSKA